MRLDSGAPASIAGLPAAGRRVSIYGAVVLDLGLPDGNGVDLIHRLQFSFTFWCDLNRDNVTHVFFSFYP